MLKGMWKNWNEILKEKDGREGRNEDRESGREIRDKENIKEEREEKAEWIGMEKDKKVVKEGKEERMEKSRKGINVDKEGWIGEEGIGERKWVRGKERGGGRR